MAVILSPRVRHLVEEAAELPPAELALRRSSVPVDQRIPKLDRTAAGCLHAQSSGWPFGRPRRRGREGQAGDIRFEDLAVARGSRLRGADGALLMAGDRRRSREATSSGKL